MQTKTKAIVLIGLTSVLLAGVGCKPKLATNQDLRSQYTGDKYAEDMVATDYEKTEDQGQAIDPRTLASIEDTIQTVYVKDFEKCLEQEMSRLDNKWVAGNFSVEFTIETSGLISNVKVLETDIKERRTLNGEGKYVSEGGAEPREATEFGDCVVGRVYKWEFKPAPEATYTHTYNGQVGEAW